MNRKDCANEFEIIDTMDYIKNERKRLTGIVNSKEYSKNIRNWGWMEDWLKQSDEKHYTESTKISNWTTEDGEEYNRDEDYIDSSYHCSICFKPARKLLHTSFSFCNEYGCGMNLCKECAEKIGALANKM
ncbi:MAG: hypothetical protein WCR36_06345 [Bacteroidaceae bacterium]